MIVVRVELWSAVTGSVTELARMHICNDGQSSAALHNYDGRTLRGRSTAQLDRAITQRTGRVEGYPRERIHVWHLVARMLKALGYE